MTEHTKTDGLPAQDALLDALAAPVFPVLANTVPDPLATAPQQKTAGEKIACNACPVLCQISLGRVEMRMPQHSFGTVPTPAIVAPMEFTMRLSDYAALGGHMEHVQSLEQVLHSGAWHGDGAPTARLWVQQLSRNAWPIGQPPLLG